MKRNLILAAAAACSLLAAPSHAHVTLEQQTGLADSYQKLTFRVGHGCDGSPTRAITVMLPESVTGTKPMPKPGWQIRTVEGKLSVPVESHGRKVTSAVREVTWSGGPLADAYFDEFTVQVKLPAEAGKLYFKIVQECVKGSLAWDELPGEAGVKLKAPAPVLNVLPAEGAAHQH
jgi:periplasmic copper chaperone A